LTFTSETSSTSSAAIGGLEDFDLLRRHLLLGEELPELGRREEQLERLGRLPDAGDDAVPALTALCDVS
jgi:hypothetical protein